MLSLRSSVLPPILLIGILATGCGGDGSDAGTPPPTTSIAKTSGDGQSGTVGQPLANPIQVTVTEGGAPSSGRTVTWSTNAVGGSLASSSITDANGIAINEWTLGTASGPQTAQAALTGAAGTPVTFTATAVSDVATSLSKAGGDGQTGEIGTVLAAPVQAKVADQFGNGVSGINVIWAVTGGTPSANTVPTNESGISAVNVTLGSAAGPITITATADALTGSPVTFTATAQVAAPVPTSASVRVGNILFASNRNGTVNPAVDTVAVGGTVTWTWTNTGATSHSVRSTGGLFTSSPIKTGNGQTHTATFSTAGSYPYDCEVHGPAMTGLIVVR
jgi:plastocyanin